MRILKENPILLVWLILLTFLTAISFFYTKIDVNLNINSGDGVKITAKESRAK